MGEKYPHTAVTTWSGFVYQGKIALYHCLSLINEDKLDFELQLDSSDDFAIYKNGMMISAHQVKAKIGVYRNSYCDDLEKSSKIEFDRIKGILRYFHVSVQLNDTSDYIGENKEKVKFYKYGANNYCGLGEIEELTKNLINDICNKRSIKLSEKLLHYNYCLLSEKISNKALEIHNLVQENNEKANEAAHKNRITAQSLLDDILNENPYEDKDYFTVDLKARLSSYLEYQLDHVLPNIDDKIYNRARQLFNCIRQTDASDLVSLCQLIKPSEKFSAIQEADIRRYCTLIASISIDPILKKIPYYLDRDKRFYLPTALDVPFPDDRDGCISDLLKQMAKNKSLTILLFEYHNLIACRSQETFDVPTKYTCIDDLDNPEVRDRIDSNITKTLCLKIITKEDAEILLNDQ